MLSQFLTVEAFPNEIYPARVIHLFLIVTL
jgi:hypothetical protein